MTASSPAPLVSIIIDNYNYARYVRTAIASALGQTHRAVEVIVVDDGSTDDSRAVIESCRDERLRSVFQKNAGQASAFNAGFRLARGEVIFFLDADDYLLPQAVATILAARWPGIGSFQFPLRRESADGKFLGVFPAGGRKLDGGRCDLLMKRCGYYLTTPTSGKAFEWSALEKIMPVPEAEFRIAADAYLQDGIAFCGEIKVVNEPLAVWRLHGKNAHTPWQLSSDCHALRGMAEFDLRRQAALDSLARRLGVALPPNVLFHRQSRLRPRLLLWKLFPQSELGQKENGRALVRECFDAVWRYERGSLYFRCKHSLFFLGAFLTPAAVLRPLLRGLLWLKNRGWLSV